MARKEKAHHPGMGPFLILISSNADYPFEVDSNLSLFLDKTRSVIKNASQSFLLKTIIVDSKLHKIKGIFPKDGWALLEDTQKNLELSHQAEKRSNTLPDTDVLLADCLHEVADSLPYTGAILRVTLFVNDPSSCDDEQSDDFIPLAGAFRRLKEWHNGQIVLVSKYKMLPASREDLVDLGGCQIVHTLDQITLTIPNWEGKVAVVDRIENKGPTFTGHCLVSDVWESVLQHKIETCSSDVPMSSSLGKRRQRSSTKVHSTQPVCGRTIEVLQEVDLRTFPLFLVDSWALNLNVQESHSDVLIKYIHELQQVGLLARLRVYPDDRRIPCCGKTNSLNTEAWKKRILENSCEEPPEKPMADDVFYLYFLILRPACPDSLLNAAIRLVLSPREINKTVIDLMTTQTANDGPSVRLNQADLNKDIHVLQSEAFAGLLKLLQEHKKNTDTEIQGLSKSDAEESHREIMKVAAEIQEKILTAAFQAQPTLVEFMKQKSNCDPLKSFQWIAESSLNCENFPERMALQAKVAKKVELQSYPSQDSLISSPMSVVAVERKRCTTDFTISDILHMFNKDGTPIAPPFTPEKIEGRNLCRVDSTPDLNTQWPNSQSLQYHDIYYYMDENDLGLEKKYSKIRDKVLEQDTLSTFVTPIKKKPQKLQTISPIRSSPRRQNSAQHLMTRSRSETGQSNSAPAPFKRLVAKDVFKQPSPSPRRLSTHMISSSNSLSSSLSCSGGGKATLSSSSSLFSKPVSHSTPLSSLPTRISPRKRVLNRSFSSASVKTLPPVMTLKNSSFKDAAYSKKALHLSMNEIHGQRSKPAMQSVNDPPVRRSPRKSTGSIGGSRISESTDGSGLTKDANNSSYNKRSTGLSRNGSNIDMDESSQQSQSESQQSKMKRSDRHKMRLKSIIKCVLEEKGVRETDTIYAACFKNLFNVSLVLLKTLTSSQNLIGEMKNVVYTQVQQIINLEKRRCGISL